MRFQMYFKIQSTKCKTCATFQLRDKSDSTETWAAITHPNSACHHSKAIFQLDFSSSLALAVSMVQLSDRLLFFFLVSAFHRHYCKRVHGTERGSTEQIWAVGRLPLRDVVCSCRRCQYLQPYRSTRQDTGRALLCAQYPHPTSRETAWIPRGS